AGEAWLGEPAPRVARCRDRARGGAVVGAVANDDLVASGHPTRELDRIFVRLSAAVREEGVVQVAGHALGDQAGKLRALVVRDSGCDRAQPVGLLLDRGDQLWVLVAEREVDELRGEV